MSPSLPSEAPFYVCGGTMTGDAPSYVERNADAELFEALLQGQYCYVLTARQMGKSSLMVRAARRLEEALASEGGAVVLLDLSSLGQNPKEESWYYSLLLMMGKRLGLSGELRELWRAQPDLPPLQRWIAALEEMVMKRFPGRVVIFLDEIDMVRSLDFKTDELFIAIRSLYNRRALEPDLLRLTFCLLGVAAPSDLIQDTHLTPFNIGTRIELTDFTLEEADVLKQGFVGEELLADMLIERILDWTGGHPYLTQCLCQAVGKDHLNQTKEAIDRLCHRMFLSFGALDKNTNLQFVRDRMLKTDQEPAAILELYGTIWSGRQVADTEADARFSVLRLSGIVRNVGGHLIVRNRIYRAVFDRKWVNDHMPDAEKRRQRQAYTRGVLRTSAVFAFILGIVGSLALGTFIQYQRAEAEHNRAEQLLYSADMSVVQSALGKGEFSRLSELLTTHRPKAGDKEDLRGWEWGYYWKLMHRDRYTLWDTAKGIICSVAFSPDGRTLASANEGGTIQLWDMAAQRTVPFTLGAIGTGVYTLAFCPKNSGLLASGGEDHKVRLWDITSRHVTPLECTALIASLAFSSNGKSLAAGSDDGTLRVWDLASHRHKNQPDFYHRAAHIATGVNPVYAVAFSPDGQWLASGYCSGQLKLWKAPFLHDFDLPASSPMNSVFAIAFAPDSRTVAVGRRSGAIEIWDVGARRKLGILPGHTDKVSGLSFSPDGKHLASGSWDNTVRLWDVAKRQTIHTFIGHTNQVTGIAFSHDGTTLASCANHEIKFWDPLPTDDNPRVLKSAAKASQQRDQLSVGFSTGKLYQLVLDNKAHELRCVNLPNNCEQPLCVVSANIGGAALSPDGKVLAVGIEDGTVTLQNLDSKVKSRPFIAVLPSEVGVHREVSRVAFSPDGKTLAVAGGDPAVVTVWDIALRRRIGHVQHSNIAQGIAFSPDGRTLAIANWQGLVYLWDLGKHTGDVDIQDLIGWRAHTKSVVAVAFSADGKTLATGSEDHTVKLWNIETHREMITFRDHKDDVRGVAFSPDGTTLATTGYDNKVWLYYADRPATADASTRQAGLTDAMKHPHQEQTGK